MPMFLVRGNTKSCLLYETRELFPVTIVTLAIACMVWYVICLSAATYICWYFWVIMKFHYICSILNLFKVWNPLLHWAICVCLAGCRPYYACFSNTWGSFFNIERGENVTNLYIFQVKWQYMYIIFHFYNVQYLFGFCSIRMFSF